MINTDANKITSSVPSINLAAKTTKKTVKKTIPLPTILKDEEPVVSDRLDLTGLDKSEGAKEASFIALPQDIPPFGTPEMYQPILHFSGKKSIRPGYPGEQMAPVKFNFDGDWDILDNTKEYRKDFYGHSKLPEVAKWMGNCYLHTVDTKIDGEDYRVYQYWHYYSENTLLVDQHEHDWENVQVYVKKDGTPKWVFTSAHFDYHQYDAKKKRENPEGIVGFKAKDVGWDGTHPRIFVAQNGHAMVADTKNFMPFDKCWEPYVYVGKMPHMVNLDDPKAMDNPFPGMKDKYGLIDKNGYLKNNGVIHNWFVRVKHPITRDSFTKGAYGQASYIHGDKKDKYKKHILALL